MMKRFPITETKLLEFRAEMFNILNHPTFSAPTSTINTSSGGQVSSTLNAARIIQLALKLGFSCCERALSVLNRRTFLAASAASVLAAAPSDTVRLGVIGSGGRGTFVMGVFQKNSGLDVAAICDVYEPNLERALSAAAKSSGHAPKAYRNYQELLADKDVDAVLIATPEHWHYQMVLDALAAGKDVYVEKPLCQTPEQGVRTGGSREEVETNHSGRHAAAQLRSYISGAQESGRRNAGQVRMVRSWWLNNYLGRQQATKLDGKLDWEQWQGSGAQTRVRSGPFSELAQL